MEEFKVIDFYVKETVAAFDFQMMALSPFPVENSPGVSIAHGYFHKLCRAILESSRTAIEGSGDTSAPNVQGKIRKKLIDKQTSELRVIARDATHDCITLMQSHIEAVREGLYPDQVDEYQELAGLLQFVLSKIQEGEFPVEIPADRRIENGQELEQEPLHFNIKTHVILTNAALHQMLADNVAAPKDRTKAEQETTKWLEAHNHQGKMAAAHQYLKGDNFDLIVKRRSDARKLVILVHGLNGNQEAYWGALPHCLIMEYGDSIDVAKWYYKTDLLPKSRIVAAWKKKPLLLEWEKIADCLLDDVSNIQKAVNKKYDSISLVGHSQGGLVSIEAAYRNRLVLTGPSPENGRPIKSVCLTDMPTKANLFAKLNRIGTLNSNAHTRLLASKREVQGVVETKLDNVKSELPFWQIMSLADEVLGPAQIPLNGLVHKHHQKQHNWLQDCQNLGHQAASRIEDFLLNTLMKD